ncbi:MAG: ArsR/SmtB family transcription factor [Bacteroidota bacterium]
MKIEAKRAFKDEIYEQFARIGKAFSSASRLELIDLLAQRERRVDDLAEETGMSVANTSRHLQVLRRERLVQRRKDGTRAFYTLADPAVYRAWRALRALAETRLAEVENTVQHYLTDRASMTALSAEELKTRLERDDVILLDVRPEPEYDAGHIPGARSLPIDNLDAHIEALPEGHEVVAYCRGPYCVYSDKAVRRLRDRGYEAHRLAGGLPDWAAAGHPVERTAA